MDTMTLGLSTTLIGMVIVFAVLIIISLMLGLLKFLTTDKNTAAPIPEKALSTAVNTSSVDEIDGLCEAGTAGDAANAELIAAITAAISAMTNVSGDRLVVRSLRKVSPWIDAARKEQ